MDIQEKKVFDAYFKEKYPELYKDVFNEDGDDRAIIGYSFAWTAWQAAKAQAVPKGFVLVNVESLALHAQSIRMFNNSDEEDDYYEIENHVCAIEAMIEAQEQSHECPNP